MFILGRTGHAGEYGEYAQRDDDDREPLVVVSPPGVTQMANDNDNDNRCSIF